MPIGSPEINKVLIQLLKPALLTNGFTKVEGRKAWSWHKSSVWVIQVKAVGKYFADVTGWPSASLCVWLGVFYLDEPSLRAIKRDEQGRFRPEEYDCHLRSHLSCTLNQSPYTRRLDNPAERVRTDIWWIEQEGKNVNEVVTDITQQFLNQGVDWFRKNDR